jgi:hypothetical protein
MNINPIAKRKPNPTDRSSALVKEKNLASLSNFLQMKRYTCRTTRIPAVIQRQKIVN